MMPHSPQEIHQQNAGVYPSTPIWDEAEFRRNAEAIRAGGASIYPEEAAVATELTIHRCPNCGHHGGETVQVGSCPRCGKESEPVPIRVRYIREDSNTGIGPKP